MKEKIKSKEQKKLLGLEEMKQVKGGAKNSGHATEQITVSWETHEIKV